jgi:hypothetical protein
VRRLEVHKQAFALSEENSSLQISEKERSYTYFNRNRGYDTTPSGCIEELHTGHKKFISC